MEVREFEVLLHKILTLQAAFLFIVYEMWVRVVGHEMPWSRVACKSTREQPFADLWKHLSLTSNKDI